MKHPNSRRLLKWCTYLLILSVAAAVFGCATTARDVVPEKGFRDITWQAPLDDFPELVPVTPQYGGRWKRFTREPETLTIGDIEVDTITYMFIDDGFAGINATFSGIDRFNRLMTEIGNRMGRPSVVNKRMNMVAWEKEGSSVLLRFYRKQNLGELKYMLKSATQG
jgi:hypothetical protein